MNLHNTAGKEPGAELVDELLRRPGVRLERIVSAGECSPPGFWYDQDEDEWVALIQGDAEIAYEDGGRDTLAAGDWVLIPAGRRHRVARTSAEPPCVWLALFVAPGG